MKTASLITGALVLTMGTATVALAHGGADRGARGAAMFEQMDTDGDGKLTQAELDAHKAARFDAADADGNGMLSAEELASFGDQNREERKARRSARMLERMDANEDGQLSPEEMTFGRGGDLLKTADKDGDGAVTLEELREARTEMRGGKGWKKRGHGNR